MAIGFSPAPSRAVLSVASPEPFVSSQRASARSRRWSQTDCTRRCGSVGAASLPSRSLCSARSVSAIDFRRGPESPSPSVKGASRSFRAARAEETEPCSCFVPSALAALKDRLAPLTEGRSEEHTSELQSLAYLVCRLLLEKKKKQTIS